MDAPRFRTAAEFPAVGAGGAVLRATWCDDDDDDVDDDEDAERPHARIALRPLHELGCSLDDDAAVLAVAGDFLLPMFRSDGGRGRLSMAVGTELELVRECVEVNEFWERTDAELQARAAFLFAKEKEAETWMRLATGLRARAAPTRAVVDHAAFVKGSVRLGTVVLDVRLEPHGNSGAAVALALASLYGADVVARYEHLRA
jgi:hypothetical protein